MSATISRRGLLAGAAGLGAAALGAPGRVLAQGSGPIRIGVLLPLTGSQATYAPDCQLSAQIAADQINAAGGLLGRKLEIVFRDDKANPNAAIAAAKELMGEGINLFVGGLNTPSALAIAGIMPDSKSVLITIGSVADSLTHESFNRNFFRITDSAYTRAQAQARLAAEQYPDLTQWGGMLPDVEFGHALWRSYSAGLKTFYPALAKKPPQISEPVLFKFGAIDFKNQISAVMRQPVEGIYQSLTGEDFLTMITQARPLGFTRKIKVFMDLSGELVFARVLKQNLPDNFWSGTHWYYDAYMDVKASRDLYEEYVKRTGDKMPSGYVGPAHMALNAFANAIKAAGQTGTDAVIGALESIEFESAKGRIKFRKEDHQVVADVNVIKLGPKDGEPGWQVSAHAKVPGADLLGRPTPGKALVIE
ncbi:ABC transporter substrate-binding protein [Prosthecodimorpha staleyi]|uniref:ABC transporter substrate-binding protein n=1 Tax=Prosthecodimorpha staleyi TaxID=2840188 RepID=A0A947GE49_9HYPH|nr:ABC transporter substrate-binding protein [Prosthecodimorpha staleyi]MBT9290991.1 ABC transporter substrate-binding protein [Prosthecodimorpha staleyi]